MKKVLTFAAAGEASTGLVLLLYPPLPVRLLFGAEVACGASVMSRIAGIALIALGLACWPGRDDSQARRAMMCYSLLVTLYFAWLGIGGSIVGILFWPAFAVHALLTVLLGREWNLDRRKGGGRAIEA